MKLNNRNLIAESFKDFTQENVTENNNAIIVPAGYIEIQLSTKGKVGAPEKFHIRNFKVGELVTLALSSTEELPRRLISTLNDMILEDDIDVGNFHDKEVEELMIYIYTNFYKSILDDMVFPINDEDIKYLESTDKGKSQLEDIKSKKWTPRTTVNLIQDVDLYEVPEDFNPNITITDKKTGFYVTFGYIKYSDKLTVKNWLDSYYKEEELRFRKIQNQISLNNSNPTNKIQLDPEEEKAYYQYISKRLEILSEVSRIISVINYNGIDITDMPLGEKYELLSKEARIDYGMINKLTERQNKVPFGIKPMVRMMNPFTNQICERRFSFRIPLIIQAIQLSGSDRYDDGYDDAD